jgi:hypothetical protein
MEVTAKNLVSRKTAKMKTVQIFSNSAIIPALSPSNILDSTAKDKSQIRPLPIGPKVKNDVMPMA